jgi:flagellin-like hook-associated protein FlgL
MTRLSTGKKLNLPGDAPSDLGAAQHYKHYVQKSTEVVKNIQNIRSLTHTADAWIGVTQDILNRMTELSISANDSSKNSRDLGSLNIEFELLKEQLSSISRKSQYNQLPIAGSDQILTYDQDRRTFVFSLPDGSESYPLEQHIENGLKSSNNIDYQLSPTSSFTLSANGRSIYYVDNQNAICSLEIDNLKLTKSPVLAGNTTLQINTSTQDLWYATETASLSGIYQLERLNRDSWTADTTLASLGSSGSGTSVMDMQLPEFKVYQDRVYYLDTSNQLVSRNIYIPTDVHIELDIASGIVPGMTPTTGQFAISPDGAYVADVVGGNTIRVTHLATQQSSIISTPSTNIDNLSFGTDNRDLIFLDSSSHKIYAIDMHPKQKPVLENVHVVLEPTGMSGYSKASINGGSNRALFALHTGAVSPVNAFIQVPDVRLNTLELSHTSLETPEAAEKTLKNLHNAIEKVNNQRTRMGSQETSLMMNYDTEEYAINNLSAAESLLRDTDMAEEVCKQTMARIQRDVIAAVIAQTNQLRQKAVNTLA